MKRHSRLWWIILFFGIICNGILLFQRVSSEAEDRQACAAMSLDSLALLESQSHIPMEMWREKLKEAGVRYFIGDQEGFVVPKGAVSSVSLPLALVENDCRTGVDLPEDFDLDSYKGPLVKTLYLYDTYANRATQGDAQEIENLLFRGVTDRGLRLLILTPFRTSDGMLILNPDVYIECLNGLGERLEARGISFGEGFSCMETMPLNPWLLFGAGLVTVALGVWLVCFLLRKNTWEVPLLCVSVVLLAVLSILSAAVAQRILMLTAAVLFPCAAVCKVAAFTQSEPNYYQKMPVIWAGAVAMAQIAGWGIVGGLHVSALMASRMYLMEYHIFSGVKAALLFPMVFAVIYLLWNLRGDLVAVSQKRWLTFALAVVMIGGIFSAFVARSGDWKGEISAVETALRNGLEYAFYARPRTKELFFAAPCVPLFLWAVRREQTLLKLFCGVGACLECVSVVNTFCHAIAPIHVSCIRTLSSAGIGLILGLAAAGILEWLFCWIERRNPGMEQAT